jgi:flagellar motor protein MotB
MRTFSQRPAERTKSNAVTLARSAKVTPYASQVLAPPIVQEASKSHGQPVDPVNRTPLEARLGHDFSKVRVHTDARASKSAGAVRAMPYTVGQDVYFGAQQLRPVARKDDGLNAHELARSIKQGPSGDLGVQTKLDVSQTGDTAEQQADTIADAVMDGRRSLATRLIPASVTSHGIARVCLTTGPVGTVVPPIVHEVVNSSGQPLDAATRGFMESRLGHDFSQVRVHTDRRAAESAWAVNAAAYTVGRNVVFGAGQFEPASTKGRRLLAHELTHVVQQRADIKLKSGVSEPGTPDERQADVVAEQAAQGWVTKGLLSAHTGSVATETGPSGDAGGWRANEPAEIRVRLRPAEPAAGPMRPVNGAPAVQRKEANETSREQPEPTPKAALDLPAGSEKFVLEIEHVKYLFYADLDPKTGAYSLVVEIDTEIKKDRAEYGPMRVKVQIRNKRRIIVDGKGNPLPFLEMKGNKIQSLKPVSKKFDAVDVVNAWNKSCPVPPELVAALSDKAVSTETADTTQYEFVVIVAHDSSHTLPAAQAVFWTAEFRDKQTETLGNRIAWFDLDAKELPKPGQDRPQDLTSSLTPAQVVTLIKGKTPKRTSASFDAATFGGKWVLAHPILIKGSDSPVSFPAAAGKQGLTGGQMVSMHLPPPEEIQVNFPTDSSNINEIEQKSKEKFKAQMQLVISYLQEAPEVTISISGHTDATGTKESNLPLSTRRAKAAEQYLRDAGIKGTISTIGKGWDEAIADLANLKKQGKEAKADNEKYRKFVIAYH